MVVMLYIHVFWIYLNFISKMNTAKASYSKRYEYKYKNDTYKRSKKANKAIRPIRYKVTRKTIQKK